MSNKTKLPFSIFSDTVAKKLESLIKKSDQLIFLRSKITAEELWDVYLNSYTPEENPIFRTKPEYDCSCCRHFIRDVGALLYVEDGGIFSVWDLLTGNETFDRVAKNLRNASVNAGIKEPFFHYEINIGDHTTRELLQDGNIINWNHFYGTLPRSTYLKKDLIATKLGDLRETYNVFKRSILEISDYAVDTVIELIEQNSIYRGKEFLANLKELRMYKTEYQRISSLSSGLVDLFLWRSVLQAGHAIRFRNSVIGTLLIDLSDNVDLDKAVASFESKLNPVNYRRPTAIATKNMIENAQKFVLDNDLESALHRRHATLDDITINNVLFANRSVLQQKGVFSELLEKTTDNLPSLDKIASVTMDDFIENILPSTTSIDIYFDSKHSNNLFSLIAPVYSDAKNILRWNNNFSWSYNGDVTDSIKERVKSAGGNVTGEFRISLSWNNTDDLDLSVREPRGEISFSNKRGSSGGRLDVDANAPYAKLTRTPVENIFWNRTSSMIEGDYKVIVNQFTKRESKDVGFDLEVELNGEIMQFNYPSAYTGRNVFLEFSYSRQKGIVFGKGVEKFNKGGTFGGKSVEKWGIMSGKFHKVDAFMLSPNHWDDNAEGNKHFMFIINGCKNPEECRGLYNEFLNGTNEHRKVFELLGNQLKVKKSDQQLSGLGFSDTKKDVIIVRVKGSFERILKILVG